MNISKVCLELPIETNSSLERSLEEARKGLPYQIAYAQETYSDELWQAMEHRELNQVQFAERADVSKQFLTKIFRGGNCTIETMVRLAYSLDYKLSIHLTPNEVNCGWLHFAPELSTRPPERFINLWTESGYEPMVIFKNESREKIAAAA